MFINLYLNIFALLLITSTAHGTITVDCFPDVEITFDGTSYAQLQGGNTNSLLIGSTTVCDNAASETTASECIGVADGDGWKFTMTDPTMCGASASYASDTTTLSWTINRRLDPAPTIRREVCSSVTVSCNMDRNTDVISTSLTGVATATTMTAVSQAGTYSVGIGFKQADYATDLVDTNVDVSTIVYVQASLTETNGATYKLTMIDCYASSTGDDSAGRITYDLIDDNGCPENADVTIDAFGASNAQFNFKMFVWNDPTVTSQSVYVHCTVIVCLDGQDCDQDMPDVTNDCSTKRKRRSLPRTVDHNPLTIGPLTVRNQNTKIAVEGNTTVSPCAFNNGGCQDLCFNRFGSYAAICACHAGRVLRDDGVSCLDVSRMPSSNIRSYSEDKTIEVKSGVSEATVVISAVAIITLLNIIGVFIIVSRKGKKYPV